MFSSDPLHATHTKVQVQHKSPSNSHDMDVVTGPSGLKSDQQPDPTEQEGGGWQHGTMS